jgi:hypothetical protein
MHERNGARELGLAVASVAVLVHYVDALPAAIITALAVAAAAAGTGRLAGEWRPWRMPLVPVVLSAVAAFAIAGISRLVDPVPWLALVFVAGWAVLFAIAALETIPEALKPSMQANAPRVRAHAVPRAEFDIPKIVTETIVSSTPELPPHPRPLTVRAAAIGLAFVAFVAAAGLVPGGLVIGGSGAVEPIGTKALICYAALCGLVAALVGYRLSGLVSQYRVDRLVRVVAFLQYGIIAGLAAALLRTVSLPRLFIPALLTVIVYLLTALRESTEPLTVNKRLLQELAVLGGAALVALVWGLYAR